MCGHGNQIYSEICSNSEDVFFGWTARHLERDVLIGEMIERNALQVTFCLREQILTRRGGQVLHCYCGQARENHFLHGMWNDA